MFKIDRASLSLLLSILTPFCLPLALSAAISGCAGLAKNPIASSAPSYTGLGTASVDPAVIQKFAPPPLNPDFANQIRRILETQAPGPGVLSPRGDIMYFGWTITGIYQVWKTAGAGGATSFPTQMTSGTDATAVSGISPDGKFLVVSRDHNGEENPGLYLLPATGGPLKEIFQKKGVRARLAWITDDAETIFYTANDVSPDSYALYRYTIETGERELLFSEPGIWSVADVSGNQTFLLARATGSRTQEFFTWGLSERKLKPILGQGEKEDYEMNFGRGEEFLVSTSKFGEFIRLYSFKNGKMSPITPDVKMDVSSFILDHSKQHLYVHYNDNGFTRLEVREPKDFKVVSMSKELEAMTGTDHLNAERVSRWGRFVALGVGTSVLPKTSYVYDWKTKTLKQWLISGLPEIDAGQFVKTEVEFAPTRDGARIPLLVTHPKKCNADPCTVIVHFHGGPEGQSRPGFKELPQIYAANGFVFVEPNVRGSDGYGKTYLMADDGPKRLNVISDIEDVARYLRAKGTVKGRVPQLGVMGGSYGGYATLMAMTEFAGSYDAGVSIVGMSNLKTFLANTAPYRRALRSSEYGDLTKDADALEKLSPIHYIDRVKAPLMIIQGVSDPRVPVGEALQMHESVEKRGILSPLILFADEGHGAKQRANRVLEIGHTLEFFKKNLVRAPEPTGFQH